MIIDGKKIAREILDEVKAEVLKLKFQPVFCDVLVGDDPASAQYVAMKAKTAEETGFKFRSANYPTTISTEELVAEVKKISQEPNMCGLIVQLPLPKTIDSQKVLDAIDPKIDVDCIGTENTAKFYSSRATLQYPTALAVMKILNQVQADYKTQKFLVVGQGRLVGKPVSYLLSEQQANLSVADINTKNTGRLIKQADIIISAAGKPGLITGDKIKPGAVIIDAGTSEVDSGIVGDVDFNNIKDIASYVSPVPGGVGPVTVAMLLSNVLKVAHSRV